MLSERDHKFALKRGADPPLHVATTQAPDEGSSPSEPDTTQLAGPWNATSQEDEIRRKEFTSWLLHRTRRVASVGGSRGRASLDERRAQRIEAKLQEKLALAEAKRAAGLAKLQQRAATSSLRREGAAERAAAAAAERSAAAAARLDADLAAAESRRLALREAEKERLRADHELVLSRLTTIQERAATESAAQLSRLEERLRLAACTREARLARRAAKAAGKVEHARNRGAACREARQQEVESKRMALERKLEEARERRESARMLAAASPLTPRSRTSLNGLAMSPRTPGAGDGGLLQGIAAALDRDAAVGNGSPGSAASPAARGKTGAASPTLEALVLSTGEAASTRSPELVSGTGQTSGAAPQQSRQGLAPAPLRLVPGPALGHVVHLHRRHTTHSAHPPHGHQHPSTLGQLTDKQQGAAALASSPSVAVTTAMAGAGAALAPSDLAMGRGAAAAATADVADAAARLEWLRLNRSTRRLQEGWRAFAVAKKTTRALAEAFVAQKVTSVKLPSAPAHVNQAAPNAPSGGDTAAGGEARPGASKPVDVPGAGGSGSGSTTVWFGVGSPRKGGANGAAPWDGGEEEAEEEGDGFERFAAALRSPATLRATQALMRRLELRLAARGVALSSAARLLRRLFPRAPRDAPLERYPPRVLLCAFMVVRYPQVVFSAGGPREMALAAASRELVTRFEALLGRLLAPSPGGAAGSPAKQGLSGLPEQGLPGEDSLPSGPPPDHLAASPVARGMAELRMQRMRRAASAGGAPLPASPAPQFVTLGELLVSFDEAWLSYLDQFVAWKGADAAALEGELVRMAAAMQASMLRKCRGDPDSERCRASSDLQTIIAQTAHDVGLLRERVAKLGGEAGLGRLEVALQAARQAVAAELAEGSASASATASEVDTDIESPSRPRPYGGAPMLGSPTRQQGAASLHAARPQGLAANGVAPATPSRLPATAPIAVPQRPQAAASPRDVPASLGAASGGESPARASLTSLSASPRTPGSLSSAALSHAPLDAVSNAAMVLDMLHAQGSYRLSASDAEGAWSRAVAAMELGFSSSAAAAPLLPPPLDMAELAAMGQEQLVRSLRSRTAAIAESAFWDNVASRLGAALRGGARRGAPALPALLAPLMSEVAAEVAGLMGSTQQAAAIRSEFSEAAVATTLEGAEAGGGVGVAVQRSLGVMQRLAGLLLAAGAPAREEEALRAHRAMKQELMAAAAEWAERHGQAAAGANSDSDDEGGRAAAPPGLASALAAALRLLAAQVKLIRVDAANSRLQMLAASLPGDSAVAYLKGKFAAIFGQQQQEAVGPTASPGAAPAAALQLPALPRTRAWLGRSTAAAAALERYLGAQGIDLRGAVAAVAAAAAAGPKADASVPAALRSGLAARPTSGSGATSLQQYPTVTPEAPVGPPGGSGGDPALGWRWLVRCGVVALVTGDAPAVGPGLAETLLWDGERLHAAQNQFQQLLVVTAGLLLVSQLRAAAAQAGAPSAASGWGPEQRAAAGRRLLVVAADPGMRLPDLTAELSAMAGVAGDTAAEERLRGAFMSLVDPSSAAFRSLANALAASLLLHVALGHGAAAPGGGEPLASRAAAALLSRVGAAALAGDVAALGGRLLSLCAVNEAVHGEAYERAVAGGLEDPQAAGQGPQHQDPGPAPPSRTGQAQPQPQPQPPQRAAQAPGAQGGQDGESSEELEEILADGDEI